MPLRRVGPAAIGAAVPVPASPESGAQDVAAPPVLRLAQSDDGALVSPQPLGVPVADASDPRWILAVRTGELLQGTLLTPESRRRLAHLGRLLDLSSFDTNLIIAIVQDQARRGYAPAACAAAGERQLAFVPGPQPRVGKGRRLVIVAGFLGVLFAVEALVLRWFL